MGRTTRRAQRAVSVGILTIFLEVKNMTTYKLYFKGAIDFPFGNSRFTDSYTIVTVQKFTATVKKAALKFNSFIDAWSVTDTTESLIFRAK
jgi:hypothetical protein